MPKEAERSAGKRWRGELEILKGQKYCHKPDFFVRRTNLVLLMYYIGFRVRVKENN